MARSNSRLLPTYLMAEGDLALGGGFDHSEQEQLVQPVGFGRLKLCTAWAVSMALAFVAGQAVVAKSGPPAVADVLDTTELASARDDVLEKRVKHFRRKGHDEHSDAKAEIDSKSDAASASEAEERSLSLMDLVKAAFGAPGGKHHPGWPCKMGEELFHGKCYVSCMILTGGNASFRTDGCGCSKTIPANGMNSQVDCLKLNVDSEGAEPKEPKLTECPEASEELYGGLCYKRCSELTMGQYPKRVGMNKCSNGKFGGEWSMGIGPCSGFGLGVAQCLPHIPMPSGMGHKMKASKANYGIAPMGYGNLTQLTKDMQASLALGNIDTSHLTAAIADSTQAASLQSAATTALSSAAGKLP